MQSLCEGWWNRSDISPELKREIPAGTESRGGIRERGQDGERCDSLGVNVILRSAAPYAHNHTHSMILCQ